MSFVVIRNGGSRSAAIDQETQSVVDRTRQQLAGLARKRMGAADVRRPRNNSCLDEDSGAFVASLPSEIEDQGEQIVIRLNLLGFDLNGVYVIPAADSVLVEARLTNRRVDPEACVVETAERRLSYKFEFACEIRMRDVTATTYGTMLEVVAPKLRHGTQEPWVAVIQARNSLAPSA